MRDDILTKLEKYSTQPNRIHSLSYLNVEIDDRIGLNKICYKTRFNRDIQEADLVKETYRLFCFVPLLIKFVDLALHPFSTKP